MIKQFLIVKKDISVNGLTVLRKGSYIADDVKSMLPFMNFDDENYFMFKTKEVMEPGTKVIYKGNKYYIIKFADTSVVDFWGQKKLNPMSLSVAGDVHLKYIIGTGMDVREKDRFTVYESELDVPEVYWFINSKGDICQAIKGENKRADVWREKMENMFKTKQSATDELLRLSKK